MCESYLSPIQTDQLSDSDAINVVDGCVTRTCQTERSRRLASLAEWFSRLSLEPPPSDLPVRRLGGPTWDR